VAYTALGLAKSYKVYPGDKVKVEAYAKYYNPQTSASNIATFATALTSAFALSPVATGEALRAYNSLNSWGSLMATGTQKGSNSLPKAFVTILLFDKNYNFLDVAYDQIETGEQVGLSPKAAHDYLTKEYTVKEVGYAYVYVSNETPTQVDVYFDDVTMTDTPTNILQVNEYYPYGLQTASSWTREGNSNNFLYNGGTEQNATTGLYDLAYRNFDPALGRFHQVDPLADNYSSLSPYNYGNNDPVSNNDPLGLEVGGQGGCNWCMFSPDVNDSNYQGGAGSSGGGWNTASGQSIVNFIAQSLYQGPGNGGSWNNGSVTMFGSDDAATAVGMAYNSFHASFGNTALGEGVASSYNGASGVYVNIGFTDGSVGINEKFISFTQQGGKGILYSNETTAYNAMWNNSFKDGKAWKECRLVNRQGSSCIAFNKEK
jgi:RHS repeat-associated protein